MWRRRRAASMSEVYFFQKWLAMRQKYGQRAHAQPFALAPPRRNLGLLLQLFVYLCCSCLFTSSSLQLRSLYHLPDPGHPKENGCATATLCKYSILHLASQQAAEQSQRPPHVRRAAGYAAAARVFAVTELLEHVLGHLAMHDLLIARHTSKHWKQVVAGSTTLSRTLFLAPAPTEGLWDLVEWYDENAEGTKEDQYRAILNKRPASPRAMAEREAGTYIGSRLNSEVFEYQAGDGWWRQHREGDPDVFESCNCSWCIRHGRLNHQLYFKLDAKWIKKPGSAREMFLTQPPAKEIELRVLTDEMDKHYERREPMFVSNTLGLRVCHLVGALRRMQKIEPGMSFSEVCFHDRFFPNRGENEAGILKAGELRGD